MLAVLTSRSATGCLTPDQILERLRDEFEEVHVDSGAGRARCAKELALLRSMNAPREIVEMTERSAASALWVTVRDGGHSFEFMLMPEANIRIDHDEQLHGVIRRCAEALNCHIEECG
jgi:hypothetical protein